MWNHVISNCTWSLSKLSFLLVKLRQNMGQKIKMLPWIFVSSPILYKCSCRPEASILRCHIICWDVLWVHFSSICSSNILNFFVRFWSIFLKFVPKILACCHAEIWWTHIEKLIYFINSMCIKTSFSYVVWPATCSYLFCHQMAH